MVGSCIWAREVATVKQRGGCYSSGSYRSIFPVKPAPFLLWKLAEDRKRITFTDGFKVGTFKLLGTRDLNFYQPEEIKRVRVVKTADGFSCQFLIDVERSEPQSPTGQAVGIDLGLEFFYTDSEGNQIENPRFLRKSEKSLKRLQRRVSKRKKGSKNRIF